MSEQDELGDAGVNYRVVGVPAGSADLHIAAVGQAGQVGRDPALGEADVGDAFGDGVLFME